MEGYVDDLTICDASRLLRRIPPWHFVFDDNLDRWRPKSAAFANHPNGSPMSVLVADVVEDTGRSLADALTNYPGFALASITAGLARKCEQGIAREPLEDEPAHAVVFGRKTKGVQRRLAKKCEWVLPPP